MRLRRITILLTLFLGAGLGIQGQSCNECSPSKKTLDSIKATAVFDANTGELKQGGLRFRQTDNVQIVIDGKNPYKYAYRVTIRSSSLESGIARGFLGLIPGFGDIVDLAVSGSTKATGAAKDLPPSCSGLSSLPDVAVLSQRIKEQADAFKTLYASYESFYKETDKETLGAACDVCKKADALDTALGKRKSFSEFEKLMQDFGTKLEEPLVKQHRQDLAAPAKQQCVADLKTWQGPEKLILSLDADKKIYDAVLPKMKEAEAAFKAMQDVIGSVRADANAFWERRVVAIPNEATQVSVSIARKNLRDKDSQFTEVAVHQVQVGSSRLHLTAGVGWSTIDNVKIVRVPGTEGTNAVQRFGYQENSKFRPSGIVNLNIPIWDLDKSKTTTLGPALGLVVSGRGESAQVEYFGGLGFGFKQDLVFLNIGLHSAKVPKLAGSYKIGDIVPSTMADPLPIRSDWTPGLMFSITVRLSPR